MEDLINKRNKEINFNKKQDQSQHDTNLIEIYKYFLSRNEVKQLPEILNYLMESVKDNNQLLAKINSDITGFKSDLTNGLFEHIYRIALGKLKTINETKQETPNEKHPHQALHPKVPVPIPVQPFIETNNTDKKISQLAINQSNNIFPDIDELHMINYNILLNNDDRDDYYNSSKITFKFDELINISKIKLNSIITEYDSYLGSLPYIYIKIEEIKGKCYTSKHFEIFGKLIPIIKNKSIQFIPDENTCNQIFSQEMSFNKLTMTLLINEGKNTLCLNEYLYTTIEIEDNILQIFLAHKYNVTKNTNIFLCVINGSHIDPYELNPSEYTQENNILTFNTDDIDVEITENTKIKLYKMNYNISCSFNFSEINTPLFFDKSIQNNHSTLLSINNIIKNK